ncbi:MAG: ATP-binding protein [Anaeromassilibacillus sp.]
MNFEGIRCSEAVKQSLSLAFQEARLPHAILLEGPAGSGKSELARWIAKAAVCTGEGERPCGRCPGCIKAAAGAHPDITIVGGGTAARSFHVDTIRQIRADAYIKPNEAPLRVFLLEGAETMSEQAQNALLKVFEEQPDRVLFLLTVTSAVKLLPTVRSRAQLFTLEGEEQADPADLELAAAICQAIPAPGEAKLLELTAPLIKDKERFRRILKQLVLLFRDACVLRAGGASCLSHQPEAAGELAHTLTRDQLMRLLEYAQSAQKAQDQNANAALLVTTFCARMRAASHGRHA